MADKNKMITLGGLIMMIFTSIFGFGNTTIAFDQMGYASIFWYILAAVLFFLPASLMFAEYGASLKEAKGGIYSWLEVAIGEKLAFIGTFIWLASWVVWLVSTAPKVWISVSAVLFGADKTQSWHFFGLSSTQFIGLLGVAWVLVITWLCTRGMDKIAKVSAVGGAFVLTLSAVFVIASLVVWIANHGQLAEPLNAHALATSPNPTFQSPVAVFSFIVYALFAYGGIESMGGVMDSIKEPEKTFPRGMVIGMLMITVMYAVMIFLWGISTNWHRVLGGSQVNLGNITFVLMGNVGVELGRAFGMSSAGAIGLGNLLTRFTGLAMFLGSLGAFFVMTYSPIKSFILGSNPNFWPERMTRLNDKGMPSFAMWVQAIFVAVVVFAVAFGGSAAQQFYLILTDMGNVANAAPYLFLVGAFPFFKKKAGLNRPFVFYKSQASANWVTIIVWLVLAGGIIFTCWEPLQIHDYQTAFWTISGPLFFALVAWLFYRGGLRRQARMKAGQ